MKKLQSITVICVSLLLPSLASAINIRLKMFAKWTHVENNLATFYIETTKEKRRSLTWMATEIHPKTPQYPQSLLGSNGYGDISSPAMQKSVNNDLLALLNALSLQHAQHRLPSLSSCSRTSYPTRVSYSYRNFDVIGGTKTEIKFQDPKVISKLRWRPVVCD